MYLEDGREIYESYKYPGYYIDANTGAFCDEEGNYIGGNSDDGDAPGVNREDVEIVFVTKSGHQYYPKRTKSATISMTLSEARCRGEELLHAVAVAALDPDVESLDLNFCIAENGVNSNYYGEKIKIYT